MDDMVVQSDIADWCMTTCDQDIVPALRRPNEDVAVTVVDVGSLAESQSSASPQHMHFAMRVFLRSQHLLAIRCAADLVGQAQAASSFAITAPRL
jgi:hypothetical protein